MPMPVIELRGIRFHYVLSGSKGPLVVFQHGLGADVSQPQGILGKSAWLRAFSFDCRGHGRTEPIGPPEHLTFSVLADDLRAILDALGFDCVVVGGISMGAGVALNFAIRYPSRLAGLILLRPAWLDSGYPANLEILRRICRHLKNDGREVTRKWLPTDPEFQRIQSISRDNAASISRQLERPDVETMITLLERMPASSPCPTAKAWRQVTAPTLVIVNSRDALHPIEYGERLAAEIPVARLVEITPKELDPVAHACDAARAIEDFVATLSKLKTDDRRFSGTR
jgi:pimeloyl-ACP methyl ester carboxylesterase